MTDRKKLVDKGVQEGYNDKEIQKKTWKVEFKGEIERIEYEKERVITE